MHAGFIPFWRGNLPNCIIPFISPALGFAFKDKITTHFKASKTDSYAVKFSKNIASGGVAGALSMCFVYSLDYAHTRLANDVKASKNGERQFNGLIDVYTKTLRSDGFVGLYRGFVISLVGIVVYRGLYFGLFDSLQPLLLGRDSSLAKRFVLGYGVTIIAGLLSYPFDTIRRRMMMRSCEPVKYKGSMDCAVQIIRREGAMSLMKGAGISVVNAVAGASLLAVVRVDKIKAWLRHTS